MDHELIPGGRNIRVTEENKKAYVDAVADYRMTAAIRPQINAFLAGFHDLIPRELISIFNDKELELLIAGLPDIDGEETNDDVLLMLRSFHVLSFVHSLTRSLTHSLTHSLTPSLAHSPSHIALHYLGHSLTLSVSASAKNSSRTC